MASCNTFHGQVMPKPRYFWVQHLHDDEPTIAKVSYDESGRETDMEFFGTLSVADPTFDDEGFCHGFQQNGVMVVPHFNILGEVEKLGDKANG